MAECPICAHIVKVCEKLGDGQSCKEFIDKVKGGSMKPEEMMKKIEDKFGSDFRNAWDEIIDNKE